VGGGWGVGGGGVWGGGGGGGGGGCGGGGGGGGGGGVEMTYIERGAEDAYGEKPAERRCGSEQKRKNRKINPSADQIEGAIL